jgi:hypothetical protein
MNKEVQVAKKELLVALAWGGGIVLLALAATLARKLGYLDQDAVLRIVIGINGLMIAYYGNRMPKALAPSAYARQIARVAGWSQVLSGLVYAGLWAFAPIPLAITLGCCAVAAGMIVTVGYCFWLRSRARADA